MWLRVNKGPAEKTEGEILENPHLRDTSRLFPR